MEKRLLTLPELGLIIFMLRGKPNVERILALLPTAEVEEMDGGMGSLRFISSKPAAGRNSSRALVQRRG